MSGMTTSESILTTVVGSSTVHHGVAQTGEWYFIKSRGTVGRVEPSDTPLFEEQGFVTLFCPADGGQVSAQMDDLVEVKELPYQEFDVGDLVRWRQRYSRSGDHTQEEPPLIRDSEYEDYFPLTDDAVGIVIEASPFHVIARFGSVVERTWGQTTEYGFSMERYRDKPTLMYTDGRDGSPGYNEWENVAVDDSDFDGGELMFVLRDMLNEAGDTHNYLYWGNPLEKVSWCQECGILCDKEQLMGDDEDSLRALKGEPLLSCCEGCREEYTYAYQYESVGYDSSRGEKYNICHHSGYLDGASDIIGDWVNQFDYVNDEMSPVYRSRWIQLEVDSWGWETVDYFKYRLLDKLDLWNKNHSTGACTFSILIVDDGKYYIRREDLVPFAAWLIKMYKKGELKYTPEEFLDAYMPTKGQIIAWFRDGTVPYFTVDKLHELAFPRVVTVQHLRQWGACSSERDKFAQCFPDGAEVTAENLCKAANYGLSLTWIRHTVFTKRMCSDYELLRSNGVDEFTAMFNVWEGKVLEQEQILKEMDDAANNLR